MFKFFFIFILINCLSSLNAFSDDNKRNEESKALTKNQIDFEFSLKNKTLSDYLRDLKDPRREAIIGFHTKFSDLIMRSKGSKSKHQPWDGGYADHLTEIFAISEIMYNSIGKFRKLPFSLDSALIVGYFHDIEKIWKYTTGEIIDKPYWYDVKLKEMGIEFTPEERNALKYIHGEGEKDYNPDTRMMKELASFCHMADTFSARLWYDHGKGSAVNGPLSGIKANK